MKLEFISKLVLGGAMLLATTTLFVGCNKYDDDIDDLNARVDKVVSDLAALQTEVDGSLTNISFNAATGVLTATKNNGSTVTVQTNQTQLPEIKLENNTLYVGGVAKGTVTHPAVVLTVVDGVLTVDGVATNPAILVGNYYMIKNIAAGTVTISLPTQAGVAQDPVVLAIYNPGATVKSIALIGYGNNATGSDLTTDWAVTSLDLTATNFAAAQAWAGPKGGIVANQNLAILGQKYALVQVTPAAADLTDVEFSFQNSVGGLAPVSVTAATKLDKVLTKADYALWVLTLSADQKVMAAADYQALFMTGGNAVVYSLVVEGGAQTSLDRATNLFNPTSPFPAVPTFQFDVTTSKTAIQTVATQAGMAVKNADASTGETITVVPSGTNVGSIYDAYLKFAAEDVIDFGIEYNAAVDPLKFKITKNPDISTPASFTVQMAFSYIAGTTFTPVAFANALTVTVKDPLASPVTLAASYTAKAAANNFFTVPMADVYTALTANNKLANWRSRVAVSFAGGANQNIVTSFKADGTTASGTDLAVPTATVVFEEKADGTGVESDLTKANYLQIYVTNSATMKAGSYVLKVQFKDKTTNEVLNDVVVNLTVALPAMSDYYKPIVPSYFNEDKTALTLYFNTVTTARTAGSPLSASTANAYTDFAALVAQTGAGAGLIFADDEAATSALDNDITYANVATWTATLADVTSYGKAVKAKVTASPFNILPAQTVGNFTVKFLSPIKEGTITAKVGGISVPSTGTQRINAADIVAKTYNNIEYTILPVWEAGASVSTSRTDIVSVTIKPASIDPAFLTSATIKPATSATVPGYIELVPVSLAASATTNITLVITDVWGFVKEVTIPVTVTVGL
jgi:hypothetical protein